MPKPRKVDRPIEKTVSLPQSTVAQVDLELFSELEGKVPFGAWAKLMTELLNNWLRERQERKGMEHGSE